MSDVAIRVEALFKKYRIGVRKHRHDTLRDHIMDLLTSARGHNGTADQDEETVWALRGVTFDVKEGEVVGIIGRNGAGKSTLLKILSRITTPTTGIVEVHGRVGSLLEVGTGFHPELTGRENIFLNGAVLGMRKAHIERKFDEIVDFAGVEKFIDTPVKRYSSGMYVRLAFAVAAHLDSEILIIDEALAVGDADFQKKCLAKIAALTQDGRTTLLVSHNMNFITSLAQKAFVLESGEIIFFGDTADAIALYLGNGSMGAGQHAPDRPPGMTPAIVAVQITDGDGHAKGTFTTGEEMFLEIEYSCSEDVKLAGATLRIWSSKNYLVGELNTFMCSPGPHRIPAQGKIRFRLFELPLCHGQYSVNVGLLTTQQERYDFLVNAAQFSVEKSDPNGTGYLLTSENGLCALRGSYEIRRRELTTGCTHATEEAL